METALIIGIPFFLFISLQLHYIKMRKAVKRRWMRGFTGIDEEMSGSAKWRKLAQMSKKFTQMFPHRLPKIAKCFPKMKMNGCRG